MTHRAGAWMAAKQVSVVSKAMRKGGGSSIGASLVAAAEAAAVAEGMSTGGGAGGCALRGMHMKRRAGGLGWNCQEATDPAACM